MALRRPCGTALHKANGSDGETVEEDADETVEVEDVSEGEYSGSSGGEVVEEAEETVEEGDACILSVSDISAL